MEKDIYRHCLKHLGDNLYSFATTDFAEAIGKLRKGKNDTLFEGVIVFLFAKTTKTFGALHCLGSDGYYEDIAYLTRGILENFFTTVHLCKGNRKRRSELFISGGPLTAKKDLKIIKELEIVKGDFDKESTKGIGKILGALEKKTSKEKEYLKGQHSNNVRLEKEYLKRKMQEIEKRIKRRESDKGEIKLVEELKRENIRDGQWSCLTLKGLMLMTEVDPFYDASYILASQYVHSNMDFIWNNYIQSSNFDGKLKIDEMNLCPCSGFKHNFIFWNLGIAIFIAFLLKLNKTLSSRFGSKKSKLFDNRLADMTKEMEKKLSGLRNP